ncbi:unnamed protein product [Vitrella brassicaformis CCMP3155]|uniref:Pescadillo homolog n=2 Tax=Vitrella brassicaformis TaxID=1169539 RepID=A0A0G4G3V2_VITBC|nr:unnamed protein product [Vitrella brassicaformis CCMP3155]|eukprot:CEM22753.1 unnamed protein product [Vitrella brassicaformis CCMP3155]
MKKVKKGTKGEAAAYLTRAEVLRKLQVSLADFRKLCILKGIYPRDPKKKRKGRDKTYYHRKDILFLSHEPLIDKLREQKVFQRKYKKALGRKQQSKAKDLVSRKPKYTLHHLVKERYPTLVDALRDLDDALSTVSVFAALPVRDDKEIPSECIRESTRLLNEFHALVARAGAMRRVFVSVKGYYLQAELLGQAVTWLLPHQFPQDTPPEVDFRVLMSFLEFYLTMLKAVNFKLCLEKGYTYPPTLVKRRAKAGVGFLAYHITMTADGKGNRQQQQQQQEEGEEEEEEGARGGGGGEGSQGKRIEGMGGRLDDLAEGDKEEGEEGQEDADEEGGPDGPAVDTKDFEDSTILQEIKEKEAAAAHVKKLFAQLVLFLNREVPLQPLALAVLSCGGRVGWQGEGSPFGEADPAITHQIVDRPPEALRLCAPEELLRCREVVQPQWVFDSLNSGVLLPIQPYKPGKTLPPHLSPFVDDVREGYVPKQRELLDAIIKERQRQSKLIDENEGDERRVVGEDDELEGEGSSGDEEEEEDEMTRQERLAKEVHFMSELDMEAKGTSYSARADTSAKAKKKPNKKPTTAANEADDDQQEKEQQQGSSRKRKATVDHEPEQEAQEADEEAEEAEEVDEVEVEVEEEEEEEEAPPKTKSKRELREEEERERAKALLSKKRRRLLHRIEYTEKSKQEAAAKLKAKRAAIDKANKRQDKNKQNSSRGKVRRDAI